jgi:hypothetical protein
MNLFLPSLKSGLKNATLWFIVFLIFSLVIAVLDGSNDIKFLADIAFYVNMVKSPLIILLYAVLVLVFSIIAYVKLRKIN